MTTTSAATIPMGNSNNNPAPSSKSFALHQRSSNTSTSASSGPEEQTSSNSSSHYQHYGKRNYHNAANITSSSPSFSSSFSPSQYLSRLTDISQMDIQSAFDQMKSLLNPTQSHRVYKLSYYRKQTKGYYARDDPAFVTLQICFLILASVAYTIAFSSSNNDYGFWSTLIVFLFHSVVINYILIGVIVASVGQLISNQYLIKQKHDDVMGAGAGSGSGADTTTDLVEWMYAFDIHCNSFFPFFIIIYMIQYFILPIVLSTSFFAFVTSNVLYTIGFGYYFYITHLGYRSLNGLKNTEVFLIPMVVVVFVFVLNFIGYPFGLGWNASRIMAHLYFEP